MRQAAIALLAVALLAPVAARADYPCANGYELTTQSWGEADGKTMNYRQVCTPKPTPTPLAWQPSWNQWIPTPVPTMPPPTPQPTFRYVAPTPQTIPTAVPTLAPPTPQPTFAYVQPTPLAIAPVVPPTPQPTFAYTAPTPQPTQAPDLTASTAANYQFSATASNACVNGPSTLAVAGAVVGDTCLVAPGAAAAIGTGVSYQCHVSAAGVVTLRACKWGTTAFTPAAGTFNVRIPR